MVCTYQKLHIVYCVRQCRCNTQLLTGVSQARAIYIIHDCTMAHSLLLSRLTWLSPSCEPTVTFSD